MHYEVEKVVDTITGCGGTRLELSFSGPDITLASIGLGMKGLVSYMRFEWSTDLANACVQFLASIGLKFETQEALCKWAAANHWPHAPHCLLPVVKGDPLCPTDIEIQTALTGNGKRLLSNLFLLDNLIVHWSPEGAGFFQFPLVPHLTLASACRDFLRRHDSYIRTLHNGIEPPPHTLDDIVRLGIAKNWENIDGLRQRVKLWSDLRPPDEEGDEDD